MKCREVRGHARMWRKHDVHPTDIRLGHQARLSTSDFSRHCPGFRETETFSRCTKDGCQKKEEKKEGEKERGVKWRGDLLSYLQKGRDDGWGVEAGK